MQLLLMRHGEASWQASQDALRPLTASGVVAVKAKADQLAHRQWLPELIIHSGYLRAQQTALLVAERCPDAEIVVAEQWQPDSDPLTAIRVLEDCSTYNRILVVTHMPIVARVSGLLCDGRSDVAPAFPTAGIMPLELDWPASGMAMPIGSGLF